MTQDDDAPNDTNSGEFARKEYELAVNTQMHFNEILMKFRSFGITVVIAIYSYAASRPSNEVIATIGYTPPQVIASAGIILTILFAFIDLGYFLPLLLGAVKRSLELEKFTTYRLTSTITNKVSQLRAYLFVITFYVAIVFSGAVLFWVMSHAET